MVTVSIMFFYLVENSEATSPPLLLLVFLVPTPFSSSFSLVPSFISFLSLKPKVSGEEEGNQDLGHNQFCRRRSDDDTGNIPVPSFSIFRRLSDLCSSYPIFFHSVFLQRVLLWKALFRLLFIGHLKAVSHYLKNPKRMQKLLFKEDRRRQGHLLVCKNKGRL